MALSRSLHGNGLYGVQLFAVTLAYVALGRLGSALDPDHGFAVLIGPVTGLALAAVWIGGYRLWPAIAVGAFVASLPLSASPLVALGLAAGITLEAVLATFVLRSIPGFRASLDRFSDVVALAAVAGVAGTLVSAMVGAVLLGWGDALSTGQLARTGLAWLASGLVGDLVVVPVVWTWAHAPRVDLRPAALAEAAALGASLLALAGLGFYPGLVAAPPGPLFPTFMLFLPMVWAALRFGTRGTATAMFLLGVVAVPGTYAGYGPFAGADGLASLITVHLVLAAASLSLLAVGAVVSHRTQCIQALSTGESLFRAVVESTTDAVYVKDREGRLVIVNAAAARAAGRPAATMIGQPVSALLPADEARRVEAAEAEIMRTGEARTVEETMTLGGAVRVYQTAKAPHRDADGAIVGLIGVSRDITEQRAVQQARAWLAAIVEGSSDAVVSMELDGTITSWNAAATRLYGYERDEVMGRSIDLLIPPERRHELVDLFGRVRRGERIESHETIRCRKDGTTVDISLTLSPVCDVTGCTTTGAGGCEAPEALVGISGIHRDLTQFQERQRLALEAAEVGVWFWNLGDDRLVWTPLSKRLYGLSADEEVSMERVLAMVHPEDRERIEHLARCALEEHVGYDVEYRVIWPDGSVHWIGARGRSSYDHAGRPVQMVGTMVDITAQKQTEQERAELLVRERAALAEAKAATRAKDEFLAVLSHELRTPLQSMSGWTQILRSRIDDPALVRKGLATLERNIKTQTQLIEDLLDISRIVAGNLRLSRQRADLADVIASSLESVRTAAEAKAIRLDATIDRAAGVVLGDADRLQQIVTNLLTNAVKFTPSGGRVAVRLERVGKAGRIIVEDTGSGIAPDVLAYVFDRFRQANSGSTRRHGGLGLGLAIVRHLVEMHGGTVKAESAGEGRGATFTVTLPLAEDEPSAAEPENHKGRPTSVPPAVLEGVRVLVVDDDADAREVLGMVLRGSGAEVHLVQSARAAIDELASFCPDLLVSDIGMPDEDGHALIREVRAREPALGRHVPAIALSAFASHADREEALAVGFEAHLAKPANADDLTRMAAALVGRAA